VVKHPRLSWTTDTHVSRGWALALAVAAGCSAEIAPGAYYCGPEQNCPDGLTCDGIENLCVLPSQAQPFACDAADPQGDDEPAAGALGAYWNVESRDAADEVSAAKFTGRAWTAADVATVERGERAGDRATIAYTIGGALLAGTITAFLITAPKPTREVIRPHFAVGPGGGVIGGAWAW
jgi:hypothetical protein